MEMKELLKRFGSVTTQLSEVCYDICCELVKRRNDPEISHQDWHIISVLVGRWIVNEEEIHRRYKIIANRLGIEEDES